MRHLVPAANTMHKPSANHKQAKHKLVPYKKQKIPKALSEQVWIRYMGHSFEGKCRVSWCTNTISVFDFQCGHNIPESRGGATTLENLIPICSRCNLGMGNKKTIDEWSAEYTSAPQPPKPTAPPAPTPQPTAPPQAARPQSRDQPQQQQQNQNQNSLWRCLVSCFTYDERTYR